MLRVSGTSLVEEYVDLEGAKRRYTINTYSTRFDAEMARIRAEARPADVQQGRLVIHAGDRR